MADGIVVQYGDYAPGAKEAFEVSASEKADFVDLTELNRYNLAVGNYGNPCEEYSVILDGSMDLFPENPESVDMGYWSESITGANGQFATPIVLNFAADGQYSSKGFTLTFDTLNNIFANDIEIVWYRNGAEISRKQFAPDSAFYFCENTVENFDGVDIIFKAMNMPHNRLKLRVVDFGYGTEFRGDQLRGVKVIQEINPISAEISINAVDFTLDSKSDVEYSFQARQPLVLLYNGQLVQQTFVRGAKRKARRLWEVQSEDYLSIMADTPYRGGIYKNADVAEILSDVFATAKVPYELEDGFTAAVSGWIPFSNCRDALQQVAIACGLVVDTSQSNAVRIYQLSDAVSQSLGLDRVRQGQSFDDESTVTAVEIVGHSFIEGGESVTAYSAEENGTGSNILVTFTEPLYSLTITNGNIVESGANYAVINANSASCVLSGRKYIHTTQIVRKTNPTVLASDLENVQAIEQATLITPSAAAALIDRYYNWLSKRFSVDMEIVDRKHGSGGEPIMYGDGTLYGSDGAKYGGLSPWVYTYDTPVMVGDVIEADTEYLGKVTGRVIDATYSLLGGITVKKVTVK